MVNGSSYLLVSPRKDYEGRFDEFFGRGPYHELWRGLPSDLQFKEVNNPMRCVVATADKPAWVYMGPRGYIWVQPETVSALKINPQLLLEVMLSNSCLKEGAEFNALDVEPFLGSLEDAIVRVRNNNNRLICKRK